MLFELQVHPEVDNLEARIVDLIKSRDLDSDKLAWWFASALCSCFQSLPKGHEFRSWSIDEFVVESLDEHSKKLALSGSCHWFEGGVGCNIFDLDIATNTDPMLYSFKFRRKLGSRQTLYVGRTHGGWIVRDA